MQKFIKILINTGFILVLIVLSVLVTDKNALCRDIDYFLKPQVGIWFGVLTPVYTTEDQLATSLGGGGYFRYNTPFDSFKIGLDSSYQHYDPEPKDGVNKLTLVPVYGNLLYRIPIPLKLPFNFQFKLGAGGCWVKMEPDDISQWDPMGMAGFEFSFAAGRRVNIGFRIDYLLIYEQHIKGVNRNGHVLNSGLTLYFNI